MSPADKGATRQRRRPTEAAGRPGRDRSTGDSSPESSKRRPAGAEHFRGLTGASHLNTPYWTLGREAILETVEDRSIGSITGPPGTGKTHLLNTVAPDIRVRVVRTEFGQRPTMRSVSRQLLDELTGEIPKGSTDALIPHLHKALRGPMALFVDEAQRLNRECIDHLRSLHDHTSTDFALVLAGGQGCWEVLGTEPQLRSRITRPFFVRPLAADQVRVFIPQLHAVWLHIPAAELDRIDAEFAGGVLRNWAAITKTVTDLIARGLSGTALIETALFKHGIVDG